MVEVSVLKNAYLVAGLKDEEIAQVAALSTVKLYGPGDCLSEVGDTASELYVILSGTVKITTHDGDLLGEASTHGVLNELSLVDALPTVGNYVAAGQVSVAAIPLAELRRLMATNRDWGFVMLANISRVLAARLRQSNARIDELCDEADEPWEHALR